MTTLMHRFSLLLLSLVLLGWQATQARATERIIVPIVFYTPDTGIAGGASVIWVKPYEEARQPRTDSLNTFIFLTQKGQSMFATSANQYWGQGNWLFTPSISLGRSNDSHYDFGGTASERTLEKYESEFIKLKLGLGYQLWPDSFLGPELVLERVRYTDLKTATDLDAYLKQQAEPYAQRLHGLGLRLQRDTRDNRFYPTQGVLSQFALRRFDTSLGSDFDYDRFELEHRRYIAMGEASVLALQAKIDLAQGQTPYTDLPTLGGANSLRGVLKDRYRDQMALSTQIEWRQRMAGRWGYALFMGAGDVFSGIDHTHFDSLKYALGAGVRYALSDQERINLRLDLGYGGALGSAEADGMNMYIQITEAF